MSHNNHNGLSQDAQGRYWEMLSPTQVLTEQAQNNLKTKSKCHGNRKLQHFKRKCRARGLNQEKIAVLIQTRNHIVSEQLLNSQTKQSTKRKRDQLNQASINSSIKSISQLSISQEASKKLKHFTQETILSFDNYSKDSNQENSTLYKTSKYLKMPRKLLLHSLRLQLNLPLKKKKEQNFLLSRLQIFDEQFRLDQIRYLYQNYFDLGEKFQIWPVSLKIILSMYILLYKLLFF